MHFIAWLLLLATLAFAGGVAAVLLARALILHRNELGATLSDTLTGPWHQASVAGYLTLAFALAWLGVTLNSGITWLCWLVSAGIVGAMATDTFRAAVRKLFGWSLEDVRAWHIRSALAAYLGAFALGAGLAWHTGSVVLWGLVGFYPALVWAVRWAWPKQTQWQEWTATVCVASLLITFALTGG